MAWYAVYEVATGRLRSQGSREPSGLPADLAYKTYPERPAELWDNATADYTTPPPLPRTDGATLFLRMTLQEHAAILDIAKTDSLAAAWVERMKFLRVFDRENSELVAGMTRLVTVHNVFTSARATEILGWTDDG